MTALKRDLGATSRSQTTALRVMSPAEDYHAVQVPMVQARGRCCCFHSDERSTSNLGWRDPDDLHQNGTGVYWPRHSSR